MNTLTTFSSSTITVKTSHGPRIPDTLTPDGVSRGNLILYYPFRTDFDNYTTYNSSGTTGITANSGATIVNNSLEIRTAKNLRLNQFTTVGGGLTVSYWIKIPTGTLNTGYSQVFEFSNSSFNGQYFNMYFDPSGSWPTGQNRLAFGALTQTNGTEGTTITNSVMDVSKVYHVVWRLTDGGAAKAENRIFLNGLSVFSGNYFYQPAATRTVPYIGRSHAGTQSQYDASFNMYDFRLYNRILSDADITTIYNYGKEIYK
jgi:hypothetical protein